MAEETQGIQNKGLFIIAVILGLIVMIAYNFHLNYVKKAASGKAIRVLRYTRPLDAGARIRDGDIEVVKVNVPDPEALGTVMKEESLEAMYEQIVTKDVRRGEYVMWGHTVDLGGMADDAIDRGNRGLPVEVDAQISPGAVLTSGSRVDLTGYFVVGGVAQSYWIIKNVRVVSVAQEPPTMASDSGRSNKGYRTILIEVSEADALKLQNILTHAQGKIVPLVRNRLKEADAPTVINPLLSQFSSRASLGGSR
jgi:Flp pilus assembly protein CpaB